MLKFDKKQLDDLICALSRLMDKNNLEELEISDNKFSYKLKKNSNEIKQIKPTITDHTKEKEKKEIKPEKSLKSPLVGTAYLSPEPGSKQFVEVGQNVKIGQVILIIEAMKTMNEIVADRNGTVKKIYIKNETPVEFGEPLVLIE
ncbi:MAG: hypothetical protein CBC25_03510 [Pelagibacteraceae bacterium TMED65]|nr:acetyl-CoA carboxylase biotin carboxyl carrier protein subunit [Rickettsiales bacterium]OUU52275.1 MAG: hypothetical protein CBC25_03510 [Pelagibacteraceae bacterium TMED65]|tara:strand:- start:1150 stop:1584 length:435 start_codon:yes stop_codon:yes gene_type:complete